MRVLNGETDTKKMGGQRTSFETPFALCSPTSPVQGEQAGSDESAIKLKGVRYEVCELARTSIYVQKNRVPAVFLVDVLLSINYVLVKRGS